MDTLLILIFIIALTIAISGMIDRERALGIHPSTVGDVCDFGTPYTARILDRRANESIIVEDADDLQTPLSWSVDADLWRGYEASRPFDQPEDVVLRYFVRFYDGSAERWMMILGSDTMSDVYFVYAFDNTTQFADRNNEHFGYHPCRAFKLDSVTVEDWINEVRS